MSQFIAHRGFPARYPENTMASLAGALAVGAHYIEFDLQMSADGVPVLLHNANLQRMTGRNAPVGMLNYADIRPLKVHWPLHIGGACKGERVPTLSRVVQMLEHYPEVTIFVEIKRDAIRRFGDDFLTKVSQELSPLRGRVEILSVHRKALQWMRQHEWPIGLIFETWSDSIRRKVDRLQPNSLFSDHKTIPENLENFWPGPWRWGFYEVNSLDVAQTLFLRGADFVETNNIEAMLSCSSCRLATSY